MFYLSFPNLLSQTYIIYVIRKKKNLNKKGCFYENIFAEIPLAKKIQKQNETQNNHKNQKKQQPVWAGWVFDIGSAGHDDK